MYLLEEGWGTVRGDGGWGGPRQANIVTILPAGFLRVRVPRCSLAPPPLQPHWPNCGVGGGDGDVSATCSSEAFPRPGRMRERVVREGGRGGCGGGRRG